MFDSCRVSVMTYRKMTVKHWPGIWFLLEGERNVHCNWWRYVAAVQAASFSHWFTYFTTSQESVFPHSFWITYLEWALSWKRQVNRRLNQISLCFSNLILTTENGHPLSPMSVYTNHISGTCWLWLEESDLLAEPGASQKKHHHTVAGRNPASPGMYKTLPINWCSISSINTIGEPGPPEVSSLMWGPLILQNLWRGKQFEHLIVADEVCRFKESCFFLTWHVPGCFMQGWALWGRVVFLGAWLVQPWIFLFKKSNFMDNKEVEILTEEWPDFSMFSFEYPMIWHRMIPTCFKKRMLCKKSQSLSQSPSRDSFHQKYGLFVQHCSPIPNSEYQKWDVLGPKPCNSEENLHYFKHYFARRGLSL